jgi:hypothetical protein
VGASVVGSWPGLDGPWYGPWSREAILNWATPAITIKTKSTMIMMRVGRRTVGG